MIFDSVTGGMSYIVGGLWPLVAGAEVCGRNPVRAIGGCSNVDIAFQDISSCFDHTRGPRHTILLYSPATRYCVQRSPDGIDRACRQASPSVIMRVCGSLPSKAVSIHFAKEVPAALPMKRKIRSIGIEAHSWRQTIDRRACTELRIHAYGCR